MQDMRLRQQAENERLRQNQRDYVGCLWDYGGGGVLFLLEWGTILRTFFEVILLKIKLKLTNQANLSNQMKSRPRSSQRERGGG